MSFLPRPDRSVSRAALLGTVALMGALPLAAPAQRLAVVPTPAAEAREMGTAELYPVTAERRALLNTIRYAEGTWTGGREEGYRIIYGGARVERLDRHPEITVRRRYVSAAAGAYQFLPATWHEASSRLGLPDFGPRSQDQAALHLIQKRGALVAFDQRGLTPEVLARLAPEWASLPATHGGSWYGQPVKTVAELQRFYSDELKRLRQS
ncbi:MAG: glycoside hydrolase family 104 protein [Cyanobacteriota bacterium]|nr:glycoside hydrolase family 104 protein [Cyanobacteriota bacterium]